MTYIDNAVILDDYLRLLEHNCKGKTELYIPCTYKEFSQGDGERPKAFQNSSAKGDTLYLKIKMYMPAMEKYVVFPLTLKNYNSIEKVYFVKESASTQVYPNDYETSETYYDYIISDLIKTTKSEKTGITTITGSNFNDKIDYSTESIRTNINAGKGNDKITGSNGDDTIIGGVGENVINASGGNDIVKLTSGEKLTIKTTDTITYSISETNKNDLVITHGDNNDTITLKNFVKSNGVGKNGSVTVNNTDLNNAHYTDTILSFDNSNKTVKNYTATITGTRLSDSISILNPNSNLKYIIKAGEGNNNITLFNAKKSNTITSGSGNDYIIISGNSTEEKALTTVKAGIGENHIYIEGSGNNSIITGKGNDYIFFANATESNAKTTLKIGGGENTINICKDSFGEIILAEEKIKNTQNSIIFKDGITLNNAIKINNELSLYSNNSSLTINNYFLQTGKNAKKLINGYSFDKLGEFLETNDLILNVTGSGTLKGYTDSEGNGLSENIYTYDSVIGYTGKAKNDKIYAYGGNDTINAGLGKNTIYFYNGNGEDTIVKGGGTDTLIFTKNSNIRFGFVDSKTDGKYDLHIYYNSDKQNYTDFAVLEEIATLNSDGTYKFDKEATSVTTIKVGSKSYKLETLLDRKTIKGVTGTIGNDDIFVNKTKGNVAVIGDAGSDIIYIGSNADTTEDNIDPANYQTTNIKPTVYTYTQDMAQDSSEGTFDKVISYTKNDGIYFAQSEKNDIKVYGNCMKDNLLTGTDDTYYTNVNQFSKIYDESGNDTLHINDANADELSVIFNINKSYKSIAESLKTDTEYTKSNILNSLQEVKILTTTQLSNFAENIENYIVDGDLNLPSVGINIDYWGNKRERTSDNDLETLNLYKGYFGGGVEKIIASDNVEITAQKIDELASTIANWLNDKYGSDDTVNSVEDVFKKGGDDAAAILAQFIENNPWKQS